MLVVRLPYKKTSEKLTGEPSVRGSNPGVPNGILEPLYEWCCGCVTRGGMYIEF